MSWKTLACIIARGRYLLLPLVLFLFTIYAFFQSALWPQIHPVSRVIVSLCLVQHLLNRTKIISFSSIYWIFGYIVLGGISILLPPSYFTSKSIWIEAVISISIGLVVWSAFCTADYKTEKIFEWLTFILCFLFAVAIILQNIDGGRFSPRKIECLEWFAIPLYEWLRKYQGIWLLLLTWVGIAYLPFSKKWREIITVLMLLACGLALFSGYSTGTEAAFILSTAFYVFGNIANRFPQKTLLLLVIGIVISIPVCWGSSAIFPQIADEYTKIFKIFNKESRAEIWNYTLQVISSHPWTGLGFGAAHTINIPFYPGKHPHSVSLMILLDLGLLGFVFYLGFLTDIILRISRTTVSLFKTMAAGSLLLSAVFIWQFSFSFWNLECLLLLCISSGLMGLRLRRTETEYPIVAGNDIKYSYAKRTIIILLITGTLTLGINYIRETNEAYFIKKIENAEISLSKDLSTITIDGHNIVINHEQGGVLRIIPRYSQELIFRGWAGDILAGEKAEAVIIFYEWRKIGIARPYSYRPGLAKKNKNLLFSGFICTVDDKNNNLNDIKKIRGVSLFKNGEARFLIYQPFKFN